MGEALTNALNHPAGKLAEAALTRLRKYEPLTEAGIPVDVGPYFDAIGEEPGGHLGRVMLATRLHYLFAVDPDRILGYLDQVMHGLVPVDQSHLLAPSHLVNQIVAATRY